MQTGKRQKVGTVIVAAGVGQRMDGTDKVFAPLGGRPVLARTVAAFAECSLVDRIVVVLSEQNIERGKQLMIEQGWPKVRDVCTGGWRRQDSVAAGLGRLSDCTWVIIHDGVRPLVTADLIQSGWEVAQETGAAIAAVPVTDTIKLAGDDRIVNQTPPRQNLWAVQTPQIFRMDMINEAYSRVDSDVTDDAALVEQLGYPVKIYMGSYDNIKITTPDDLALAEVLWRKYER